MLNPVVVNELMDCAYHNGAYFAEAKIANRRHVLESYTEPVEFDLGMCAELGEYELMVLLAKEFRHGMEQEAKNYGVNVDNLIGE